MDDKLPPGPIRLADYIQQEVSTGVDAFPSDEDKRRFTTVVVALFAVQLLAVLGLVVTLAIMDYWAVGRAMDLLAAEKDLTHELVTGMPRFIRTESVAALIAGTVAQAGFSFYLIAKWMVR